MMGQIVSHYRLLDEIGGGGMGVVYRAEDLRLKRHVAVKFLSRSRAADPAAVERFRREAEVVSALNHPYICTLHDVGEAHGRQFLVLELLEGRSLDTTLADGPLTPERTLTYALQIADALDAAHAKGIVHRDLKPSNLWVTARGDIKILDFGVAKLTEVPEPGRAPTATRAAVTAPGDSVGTPRYMSPEQVRGEPADARSDLFSLGLVMYEMATGRPAFSGSTVGLVLDAVLNIAPDPLSAVAPAVPLPIEQIVSKAIEKDPALRYQSARDLMGDLRRVLRDIAGTPAVRARESSRPAANEPARFRNAAGLFALFVLVALSVGGWLALRSRSSAKAPILSLAVLPLENLSNDPAQDYFADGMTDELITEIAKIRSLRVISRFSATQYRNAHKTLPAIARELGVDAIVTGAVVRTDKKVRITAHLIRASDDRHLWSDQFERDLTDVIALQGEVAQTIADHIQLKLESGEHPAAAARPLSGQAYEAYLQGGYFRNKGGEENLNRSIRLFEKAIALDPSYAQAYAGMSETYIMLGIIGLRAPKEVYPNAKAAALTAVGLDDTIAAAHHALADVKKGYDWDWPGAEAEYKLALMLNPSDVIAHMWYAELLSKIDRYDEAVAEARRARQLDPVSLGSNTVLGMVLYRAGRYDEAIEACRRALELDPHHASALWFLALAHEQKGDLRQAISELTTAVSMSPAPLYRALLGHAYGLAGDRTKALEMLENLTAASRTRYISPVDVALIHTGLGDRGSAFTWLEKAYQERTMRIQELGDPVFRRLRADPRFASLMKRVGLPMASLH